MWPILALIGVPLAFVLGWGAGRMARTTDERMVAFGAPLVPTAAEVVEGHPTGVVVGDGVGRVLIRNAAARALAGTHVGVLIDEVIDRHLNPVASGQVTDEVVELYGPPKRVVMVASLPLPNGGSVVFVDDVSEHRRLDAMRTDFVANISHELKTPIGALAVLAEMLSDESDAATIARLAGRMSDESRRASETIDDLMELSRIELGEGAEHESVHLSDVIRVAVDRVTELAVLRDVQISMPSPVDDDGVRSESCVVAGDRRQLISAVGNLVENAVKYSESGGQVQIGLRQDADQVEIMVSDQGAGIPQRDLGRVFERFYRVDQARSRDTGGTGLGLSIVRHIATNHGGEVMVSSTEGEGSTFVLRLPVQVASSDDRQQSDRETNEGVA